MAPKKVKDDEVVDDVDDTDDDEPPSKDEVRGWVSEAVETAVAKFKDMLTGGGGDADDTDDDAGADDDTDKDDDAKPESARNIEKRMESIVSKAIDSKLGQIAHDDDHKKMRETAHPERPPRKERKLTKLLWGSSDSDRD